MKKIVCELCGSSNFLKKEGVFVCQDCGTKYSLDEAKNLMQEVEGDPDSNNDIINNYLTLAQNALETENNKEAESYANKIIENEPRHSGAWKIKGCAAYRKDTSNPIYFKEAISAWNKAVSYSDGESRKYLIDEINKEIKVASSVLLYDKCMAFKKTPNDSFGEGLVSTVSLIANSINTWAIEQNTVFDMNDVVQGFSRSLANAAMQGFATLKDACKEHYELLNGQANRTFRKCGEEATQLLHLAFEFSRNTDDSKTILHEIQKIDDVLINRLPILAPLNFGERLWIGSMKKELNEIRSKRRGINLESQKTRIIELCAGERVRKEKQAAIDQYWAQFPEKKKELQTTVDTLTKELEKLNNQMDVVNVQSRSLQEKKSQQTESEKLCDQIESEISTLQSELNTLGFFQGKRKRELTSLIEQRQSDLENKRVVAKTERDHFDERIQRESDILSQQLSDIRNKNQEISKRRNEALAELSKDRGSISSGNPYYIEGSIKNGSFAITVQEYADKVHELLESTYSVPDHSRRVYLFDVREDDILKKYPHAGKYGSLGYHSVSITDNADGVEANGDKNLDVDVIVYTDGKESPMSAVVVKIASKHPSEHSDVDLKAWCILGSTVLCSFIKDLSPTEAITILADMIMSDGTQVYQNNGVTANLLYTNSSKYKTAYHRQLLVRCN